MKKAVCLFVLMILFFFFLFFFVGAERCRAGLHVAGKVLRVPQEYLTIQAAIDAAQNLDTVLVSEGTYYENIKYKGKGIVVTSRYGATKDWETVVNTIVDGSTATDKNNASTVQFMNAEDSTAVLDGFTITGGTGTRWVFGANTPQEGGGIILAYSSAIIRNNIIRNNMSRTAAGAITGGGGGISSMYGNPTICNNVIVSNTSGYAGGIVLNWSRGVVRNNVICHNTTMGLYGGGGIMIWQAPQHGGIVENNSVVNNTSAAEGGGIMISVTDTSTIPVVRNNVIWGNKQASGSQVGLPEYLSYNSIEDYSSGSNVSYFPRFEEGVFLLSGASPCVDAGDPAATCNDVEDPGRPGMGMPPSQGTVRNDMGAYGGRWAQALTAIHIVDLQASSTNLDMSCPTGQQTTATIRLRNMGSVKVAFDSVAVAHRSLFSPDKDCAGLVLDVCACDSLRLTFLSGARGRTFDTLRVRYHAAGTTGVLSVSVVGISNCAPYLHNAIPPQTAYAGRMYTLRIPDSTFVDGDAGDTLAYQVTGLPRGLSFDPQTLTIQGIPGSDIVGIPLSIGIAVKDEYQASASTQFILTTQTAAVVDDDQALPTKTELMQNYPNPFNPTTTISYQLSAVSKTKLAVFDLLGRELAVLVQGLENAGRHEIRWDAVGCASGIYLCKLVAISVADPGNTVMQVKRMLLIH
jgi:hypothetical protein